MTDMERTVDEDMSEYVMDPGERGALDLGGLFSGAFANVALLNRAAHGPAELYTATRYGKRFVLKGLRERFRDDPIHQLALVKEFEIGMRLDHPNIRRTMGIETVAGLGKVIVLEYVDGTGLDSVIAGGKLHKDEAREICRQTAAALGYMHRKGVFHRDLKPSNILVSHGGGVVKVIDFSLSDSDDSIVLKNPAGSRRYMAPEQSGGGVKPSPATDIYSFGVIAGELARNASDVALEEAAERCMAKDPGSRPGSVGEIGLPAVHPSFGDRLSEALSAKWLTYVLAGFCTVLAALIGWRLAGL